MFLFAFFIIAFFLRLLSLSISIKNEKHLKDNGAQEYGRKVSIALAIVHTLFYLASFGYAFKKPFHFDTYFFAGIAVYIFSMGMLFIVIKTLGDVWSVKLIIASDHHLNESFIFKYFKHPNYFLNIIPELIGLTLALHSWKIFFILFPVYVTLLILRINQEERVMKEQFLKY